MRGKKDVDHIIRRDKCAERCCRCCDATCVLCSFISVIVIGLIVVMIAAPQLEEKRSNLVSTSISVLFPSLRIEKLSINLFEIRAKNVQYDLDSKTTLRVEEVLAVQDTYDLLCVLYGALRFREIRVYGVCIIKSDSYTSTNTTSEVPQDTKNDTGACDWIPSSLWSPSSIRLPDTDVRVVTFVYGCGCTSDDTSGTVVRVDARVNTGGNSIDIDGTVHVPSVYGHQLPFTYHGRKEMNYASVAVGSFGGGCEVGVTDSTSVETLCTLGYRDFEYVSVRTSLSLSSRRNNSCGISLRNIIRVYVPEEAGHVAYLMADFNYTKSIGVSAALLTLIKSEERGELVKIEYKEDGSVESVACIADMQPDYEGINARCVNALPINISFGQTDSHASIISGHFSANMTFTTSNDTLSAWIADITIAPACSLITCRITGELYEGNIHCEVIQDENNTLANMYASLSYEEKVLEVNANASLSGQISRLASCWNIAPITSVFSDSIYFVLAYNSESGITGDSVSEYVCISKGEENGCVYGADGIHVWHDTGDERLYFVASQILSGSETLARDVIADALNLNNGNYSITVNGQCYMIGMLVPLHVTIEAGLGDLLGLIGF